MMNKLTLLEWAQQYSGLISIVITIVLAIIAGIVGLVKFFTKRQRTKNEKTKQEKLDDAKNERKKVSKRLKERMPEMKLFGRMRSESKRLSELLKTREKYFEMKAEKDFSELSPFWLENHADENENAIADRVETLKNELPNLVDEDHLHIRTAVEQITTASTLEESSELESMIIRTINEYNAAMKINENDSDLD